MKATIRARFHAVVMRLIDRYVTAEVIDNVCGIVVFFGIPFLVLLAFCGLAIVFGW
jgi:hypothetical protein